MARTKRPWGVKAAPFIFLFGMAAYWGGKSVVNMRDRVEHWGHELANGSGRVVMEMPRLPLVPPLFVNSERVGRIETIVLDRSGRESIDSLRIVAAISREHLSRLADCEQLRLRVGSADLGGLKRALRCTRDDEGLVPFGHLETRDASLHVPIKVRLSDLPCDQSAGSASCSELARDLRAELESLRRELRAAGREIRSEMRDARHEIRSVVRSRVR